MRSKRTGFPTTDDHYNAPLARHRLAGKMHCQIEPRAISVIMVLLLSMKPPVPSAISPFPAPSGQGLLHASERDAVAPLRQFDLKPAG